MRKAFAYFVVVIVAAIALVVPANTASATTDCPGTPYPSCPKYPITFFNRSGNSYYYGAKVIPTVQYPEDIYIPYGFWNINYRNGDHRTCTLKFRIYNHYGKSNQSLVMDRQIVSYSRSGTMYFPPGETYLLKDWRISVSLNDADGSGPNPVCYFGLQVIGRET